MSEVSILGTGRMGAALARTLLGHGLDVCVWNRTASTSEPLLGDGARVADSPYEAVRASPLSVALLSDYAAVLEVIEGIPADGEVDGHVLVNLTTGAPEQVGACHRACQERGLGYLDGAVSGHPQDLGHPASQILVAGDEATWRAHRATVERFAGETVYLGDDVAAASALDLAMVGCFQTVALCAFVEAAAYAAAHGVDATVLTPLAERLLGKMRGQVAVLAGAIHDEDYATDQASIGVYVAALDHVRASMRADGLPARLTSAARENAAAAVAAGRGDLGLAAQFEDLTGRATGR
jgi:3-hydroxyisobutyrate dehydrogenase-like beta-hydroxyacid dehydrogenase